MKAAIDGHRQSSICLELKSARSNKWQLYLIRCRQRFASPAFAKKIQQTEPRLLLIIVIIVA
jgi:hypothetical protein